MRLSQRQAQLTMESLTADPANKAFHHQIDIKVITDGEHHVLDQLTPLPWTVSDGGSQAG